MRRNLIGYILLFIAAFATAVPTYAASKWESVKTERPNAKPVVKDAELEIKTAPSIIIVSSNHQVQIKIFTILGRLVNSETLSPGTSQLTLPAHGVYIVKIGSLTCKVAV